MNPFLHHARPFRIIAACGLLASALMGCFAHAETAVPAAPDPPPSAAETAYREGRYGDAVRAASETLGRSGSAGRLHLVRGMALEMTGRPDKASDEYEATLRLDPDNYEAMAALAGLLERSGKRMDEAARLYARAAELDPRPVWKENLTVWAKMLESRHNRSASAVHRWNLGAKAASAGDDRRAVALFTEALELDPEMYQAYMSRAMARIRLNSLTEALDDLNQGLNVDLGYPGGLVLRGKVWENLGDADAALKDYRAACEILPRAPDGYLHKGRLLESRGDRDGAAECYRKGLKLRPTRELGKTMEGRLAQLGHSSSADGRPEKRGKRPRRALW